MKEREKNLQDKHIYFIKKKRKKEKKKEEEVKCKGCLLHFQLNEHHHHLNHE